MEAPFGAAGRCGFPGDRWARILLNVLVFHKGVGGSGSR